jgi:WD40 repeat protein
VLLATGSYDGQIRLWDAAPGHELLTIPAHQAIVWNVAYSPTAVSWLRPAWMAR